MKAYKATIFHAGKQNHQITKENLSASEIVILKSVHGSHAVVDLYDTGRPKMIQYTTQDENGREDYHVRPATVSDEKEYLSERYGEKVFSAAFPGAIPVLPTDLEQVGIEYVHAGQVASMGPEPTTETAPAEEEKKSKLPKFLGGN